MIIGITSGIAVLSLVIITRHSQPGTTPGRIP